MRLPGTVRAVLAAEFSARAIPDMYAGGFDEPDPVGVRGRAGKTPGRFARVGLRFGSAKEHIVAGCRGESWPAYRAARAAQNNCNDAKRNP